MGRIGKDRPASGVIRAGPGMLVFGCLTALVVVAPTYLSSHLRPGSGEEPWSDPPSRTRGTVGARVVEARFSDGFWDLAETVARSPEVTSWDSLRGLLEQHGETDLWYSVRVAWLMDDGTESEVTYVRQPYHDAYNYVEFLKLARGQCQVTRPETILADTARGVREPGTEHQDDFPETLLDKVLRDATFDRRPLQSVSVR